MALFLIELRILFIIMLAEIYNSISKRNFIRLYNIEYFLDSQCNKIAKYLRKSLKLKINHSIYKELVIITRIQKGGGLRDIYKRIVSGKRILTLSTSIFDFRTIEQKDYLKKINYEKISIFGMIPRIRKMVGYISNDSIKKIHILNDPCDPLIYISYLIYSNNFKSFVFYHHADHTFCFGALEKRWTHIDFFQNQYQLCKKKLNPIFNSMINFL